jgi:hypothetical protein
MAFIENFDVDCHAGSVLAEHQLDVEVLLVCLDAFEQTVESAVRLASG